MKQTFCRKCHGLKKLRVDGVVINPKKWIQYGMAQDIGCCCPKRPSIFDKDSRPYGINEGEWGNSTQWKRFFNQAMGMDEANAILSDSSPWGILGIPEGSSLSEIKSAFRSLCFKVHPDYGGTTEEFNKVYASYTVLVSKT